MLNKEIYYQLNNFVLQYGEFMGKGDFSEGAVSELFSPDAKVQLAVGGIGKGISEVADRHIKMMESFDKVHYNITNLVIDSADDEEDAHSVKFHFHLEALELFKAEIAKNLPGNLFIVDDTIECEAVKENGTWKFTDLVMIVVFKRFHNIQV